MVVAQLVRAPDCGSGGRGFETHLPPYKIKKIPKQNLGIFLSLNYFNYPKTLTLHPQKS